MVVSIGFYSGISGPAPGAWGGNLGPDCSMIEWRGAPVGQNFVWLGPVATATI